MSLHSLSVRFADETERRQALCFQRAGAGNCTGDGAEAFYRRALAVGRGVGHRYRIFLAQASTYLGILLTNKQSYADAESVLRESERVYREILGGLQLEHP